MFTRKVYTDQVATILAKAEKLNKRGATLVVEVNPTVVNEPRQFTDPVTGNQVTKMVTRQEITISGSDVAVPGYIVIGEIALVEGHRMFHIHHDAHVTAAAPFLNDTCALHCDHCRTDRIRKSYFLLKNTDSGAVLSVGRTCLKDFVGVGGAEALLMNATFLAKFDEEFGEDNEKGGRGVTLYTPEFIYCMVKLLTLHSAYITRNKADDTHPATADVLLADYNEIGYETHTHANYEAWKAEFADAVALLESMPKETAFDYSLSSCVRAPVIERRSVGTAAYLCEWYRVQMAKRATANTTAATPCPTGKTEIVGKIVKFGSKEYMGYVTTTCTILSDAGYTVHGTLPAALLDCEIGNRVRFTAHCEPREEGATFGFYKRPSKAEVLTA